MVGVGLREARAALESFRGKNVLVIGDAMLDEYYIGPTARLAPEAPVPLIAIQEHSYDLGGAANVAKNVRALGGQARLAAVVGLDQPGLELRALLGRKGIDAEGVETDGGRITTVKTRVKTDGLLIVRYDRETAEPIDGVIEERLLLFLRQAIPKTDAITISDYSKGVLTPAVVARINELAKQHNVPIIADSKQLGKLGIKNINILKQNWRQASIETGIELDPSSNESCERTARKFLENFKPNAVVLTRTSHGMTFIEAQGKPVHLPAIVKKPADVNGAGDTVLAVLALSIAAKVSLPTAAFLATTASAIVVNKPGTGVATPTEIESLLKTAK